MKRKVELLSASERQNIRSRFPARMRYRAKQQLIALHQDEFIKLFLQALCKELKEEQR